MDGSILKRGNGDFLQISDCVTGSPVPHSPFHVYFETPESDFKPVDR